MARKLNRNRSHASILPPDHGASYMQDGCYFDAAGGQVIPPGHTPPKVEDIAPRMSDGELLEHIQDTEGLSVTEAAARIEAIRKGDEPEPTPTVAAINEATIDTAVKGNGAEDPPEIPTIGGLPPWEWGWSDMLSHIASIGRERPQNKEAAQLALKKHYGNI